MGLITILDFCSYSFHCSSFISGDLLLVQKYINNDDMVTAQNEYALTTISTHTLYTTLAGCASYTCWAATKLRG